MAATHSAGSKTHAKPSNVQQIAKRAQQIDYKPLVPLKYWLRSAKTLLKEAEIYEREGDDEQTYLLLFRHAQLVLGHLPTHPEAKHDDNRALLAEAEKQVSRNLARLEALKPRINKRHERYEQLLAKRTERKVAQPAAGQTHSRTHSGASHGRHGSDPTMLGNTQQSLAAGEHKELAVELAHAEFRRRAKATARRPSVQAGIPLEVSNERRGGGVWDDALAKDGSVVDTDILSQQMQNVRLQMDGREGASMSGVRASRAAMERNGYSTYNYPTIPSRAPHASPAPPSLPSSYDQPRSLTSTQMPPRPPPKDFDPPKATPPRLSTDTTAPPRPEKPPAGPPSRPRKTPIPPSPPSRFSTPSPPPPSSSTTAAPSSNFTFRPSAHLENGTPLRTLFLPPDLRARFLALAAPNTAANLETCGILCGTLIANALFVSKLVIPEQESTSDTCETVNEGEMFDYVDGEDLMVLGWIHTHPTQTCFMSSRDLHTHCGYQVMMPESIAIVCAPSRGDWGCFRLTDPPGMKAILGCTQTGLFHPHAEEDIYTDALRPGHVFEAKGMEFEVVDMRVGK